MIGTYDIVIAGPKRQGRGTLAIDGAGSSKTAHVEVENFGSFELGLSVDGSKLSFDGVVETPELGSVSCQGSGEVWGNSLDARATTDRGEATIYGTRVSSSTGDAHGNDPLWAGRWSDAY